MPNVAYVEDRLRPMVETDIPVVIDLAELMYCDSQGVRLFFNLGLAAKSHGGPMTMANAHGIVKRVFDITHLGDVVDVVDEM